MFVGHLVILSTVSSKGWVYWRILTGRRTLRTIRRRFKAIQLFTQSAGPCPLSWQYRAALYELYNLGNREGKETRWKAFYPISRHSKDKVRILKTDDIHVYGLIL